MEIAVIGGGAAGFFAAINAKENYPDAKVVIFEKSKQLLAKVRISGGGRCNLTNNCATIKELASAYPRGGNALKKAFRLFDNKATMRWFESRGVPLVTQEDNCVFPQSQSSQSIIDCFLEQTHNLNIHIELKRGIKNLRKIDNKLQLEFIGGTSSLRAFDKVIVAIGGTPSRDRLMWLEKLDHLIADPVPSLFTFRIPDQSLTELMGIVVENTLVSIQGTGVKSSGPLLITHWGMSGPAILKLSALGARILAEKHYRFNIQVNWTHERNQELVVAQLQGILAEHPRKMLTNVRPYALPERLWDYLLGKSGLTGTKKWGELGKGGVHRLANVLTNDVYTVKGQTQFRDEFVTCGGVSLDSVDLKTMQSKTCKNLYFAGEILDIDGLTGGYNFQAAWTTAFIAARLQ